MKKVLFVVLITVFLMISPGCSNSPQTATSSPNTNIEEVTSDASKESPAKQTSDTPSKNDSIKLVDKEGKELLAPYSNEQIEYARIWLQRGPNQEIDELNVLHIPAGTPINPDDETSARYPENVIQLAGSRLVDGSVTYSSNGDGTINVYNVPLRWDGNYPAGEDFYTEIIENTELVSVQEGNNEKIIELIKLLIVHS
ncbi:hypothetical protein [Neobacillus niacini]|uniref:hypothetical protein n=1 Tax=Neobacillus niacini TaxID=86668 RepID=UPI00203F1BE9|nr:hypothetical protein [Neobacillus niacini]MCM3690845.1 hypothetical protein [Neobacillus niacini]